MRRFLIVGVLLLTVFSAALTRAHAETTPVPPVVHAVLQSLTDDGYAIVSVQRTWLGRIRIEANTEKLHREIVMNPLTGEILRDITVMISHATTVLTPSPSLGGGGGGGSAGASTGDDDDHEDDPEDGDHEEDVHEVEAGDD
jgi:hypothetical protein